MIFKCYVFFFLIIGSFVSCDKTKTDEYDRNGRNRAVKYMFKQTEEHFYTEYGLDLIGPTMSSSQGPIERFMIVLEKEADPSIDEAKAMLVGVTSYFYDLVKSDENLAQYLAHPPFQLSDLGVLIVFEHYNLPEYPSPFVVSIVLRREKVKIRLYEKYEDLHPIEELWFSYAELEREFGEPAKD